VIDLKCLAVNLFHLNEYKLNRHDHKAHIISHCIIISTILILRCMC